MTLTEPEVVQLTLGKTIYVTSVITSEVNRRTCKGQDDTEGRLLNQYQTYGEKKKEKKRLSLPESDMDSPTDPD